ncbi:MAG: dockerin type I repeat-containing protein [Muribaculaceae bacterium]|nr:dockerin type I repeat-containing protein [Muribaculaceae bacterium]
MKRFFTFVFSLVALAMTVSAQDINMSYVFVDANGNVLENGATVVVNTVEQFDEASEVIYSGISVKNTNGSSDWLRVIYNVEQIDNGSYQICFPTNCNYAAEVGEYMTGSGQLMGETQNIQSEWFPTADGTCVVNLTIELLMKMGGFPPVYIHKDFGPSLTIKFVKGDIPGPEPKKGDVNGDGEVNIADVNELINQILTGTTNEAGDVNDDNEVNIADVNALIDMILSN